MWISSLLTRFWNSLMTFILNTHVPLEQHQIQVSCFLTNNTTTLESGSMNRQNRTVGDAFFLRSSHRSWLLLWSLIQLCCTFEEWGHFRTLIEVAMFPSQHLFLSVSIITKQFFHCRIHGAGHHLRWEDGFTGHCCCFWLFCPVFTLWLEFDHVWEWCNLHKATFVYYWLDLNIWLFPCLISFHKFVCEFILK